MDVLTPSSKAAATRTVALAGATGLVGRAILEGLLADRSVTAVHVLGRRKPGAAHAKLTSHVVEFAALPALPPLNEVYLALGTTIKVAGSQAAVVPSASPLATAANIGPASTSFNST